MTKHPTPPHQQARLEQFVTDTQRDVFALKALPEAVKGALFARYSRSALDLRGLLQREFLASEGGAFGVDEQKARAFYQRVLDDYGDDSVGELGGAHLALENISMLAANQIQAARIGGSPLEKSTRYVRFDDKVNGEYRFYQDPHIMASPQGALYLKTVRHLFDCYGKLLFPLQQHLERTNPRPRNKKIKVWHNALHARALDALRGLLPVCTQTNLGLYGNGRFFQTLITNLRCHALPEMQALAASMQQALEGVIPSFVVRSAAGHASFHAQQAYHQVLQGARERTMAEVLGQTAQPSADQANPVKVADEEGVRLLGVEPEETALSRVLAAWLYGESTASWQEMQRQVSCLTAAAKAEAIADMGRARKNRRHKPPRATEFVFYTFELQADFGAFRDLHRHRTLTQQRQGLGRNLGYTLPPDLAAANLDEGFHHAMEQAAQAHQQLCQHFDGAQAAYVLPMAYRVRWQVHINLRALIWLTELRTAPQGHAVYRRMAWQMYAKAVQAHPAFKPLFKFVSPLGKADQGLERLGAENNAQVRQAARQAQKQLNLLPEGQLNLGHLGAESNAHACEAARQAQTTAEDA